MPEHCLDVRVYLEDTDAGGMVYHASYIRFAERARTELLRRAGFSHRDLLADHGVLWVVRDLLIDYRAQARLDDQLRLTSRVVKSGVASLTLEQIFTRPPGLAGTNDRPSRENIAAYKPWLAYMRVRLACVDTAGRPTRMPADLARWSGGQVRAHPGVA